MKGDDRTAGTTAPPPSAVGAGTRAGAPVIYALVVALAAFVTLAALLRTQGVFACQAAGADFHIAYCHADRYGDYDRGAFYFGLEPRARDAAAGADVLFLGSSRLQFAFSSRATDAWFKQAGLRYYLLGFTHTENMTFSGPLLDALKPHARAYVINVDRFFDDRETPPTRTVLHEKDARERYAEKRFWQRLQHRACTLAPVLCGSQTAYVRTQDTGAWHHAGSFQPDYTGVGDDAGTDQRDRWDAYVKNARAFVAKLPVERGCVFLTLAPSQKTRTAEARAIAEALGRPLLTPRPEGLRTFDTSHLDRHSADAFSAAFLAEAGPDLARCAGKPAAAR